MLSQVTLQEINYGLTNCTWSSCREGCTAEFFKCHHIRVSYTPQIEYDEEQGGLVTDFEEEDWAYLDRTERKVVIISSISRFQGFSSLTPKPGKYLRSQKSTW